MQQLKNTVMDCYTVFFHAGHATVSKMETVRFLPATGDPDDSFLYDERGGFLKSGKSKYLLVRKGQTLHTHLFLKIPQRIINTKIPTYEKTMQ